MSSAKIGRAPELKQLLGCVSFTLAVKTWQYIRYFRFASMKTSRFVETPYVCAKAALGTVLVKPSDQVFADRSMVDC